MRRVIAVIVAAFTLGSVVSVGVPILDAETDNAVIETVADVQPAAAAGYKATCSARSKSASSGIAYSSTWSAMSVCLSKLDANDDCWWGFTYEGYGYSHGGHQYRSISRQSNWWCGHGSEQFKLVAWVTFG